MKLKTLLTLLLCVFLFSCGDGRKNKRTKVSNDFSVVAEVKKYPFDEIPLLDMSNYFDSVKYILLEAGDDFLISGINELFFTDSLIIVADAGNASVFFFDLDGKYSHKINRRGRGPGEYLKTSRVMVDELNQTVMIYDIDSRKLLRYDFNGNHINTINDFCRDGLARDIINLPSGDFVCYKQDYETVGYPSGVWIVDSAGSIKKELFNTFEVYPNRYTTGWYNLYLLPDGKVGFIDQSTTNIYYIENDIVYQRVEFKMPDKTTADFAGIRRTEEQFVRVFSNYEKGDYIFTNWISPDQRGFETVFSKTTNTLESFVGFHPFLGEDLVLRGEVVRNNRPDIYTSWVMPTAFGRFLNPNFPEEYRIPAGNILGDMSEKQIEAGNPVIQVFYVKNNN